jgi:capsular exopolysaccharide synthesis family protein
LIFRGTVRRRYRVAVEVAADLMDHVPFVAVVPDLSAGDILNAPAARSIHDLRVRLQPPSTNDHRTYLVTSASSGEGKSSVVLALGLSFAAAGFRTLIVDCDLASRRMSSEFNAADLPGIIEATAGAEPNVQRVRSGLSVLTAGKCRPHDAARLAPAATARVLAAVRDRFDIVLIDSDPILSGLTASVIAPQVDGVVLTLAREQEHTLVQGAANHLRLLGATLAGAVFNRAAASDFSAILHQQSEPFATERVLSPRLHRFGPLVGAVLSSLSLTRDDDLDLMTAGMSLARTDEAPTIVQAEKSKRDVA